MKIIKQNFTVVRVGYESGCWLLAILYPTCAHEIFVKDYYSVINDYNCRSLEIIKEFKVVYFAPDIRIIKMNAEEKG